MNSRVKAYFPFYHMVPKGLQENLRFRRIILSMCSDPEVAADIREMCRRDFLFWLNTFGWTMNPRARQKGLEPRMPMITYPFQDLLALEQLEAMRMGYDLPIAKSRDMGATWILVYVRYWRWANEHDYQCLIGSRKEEFVDSKSHKSLFSKLDWQWLSEPAWLRPARDRTKLSMKNLLNGSSINGESTNPDFGRGDRASDIMLDEFAAVEIQVSRAVLTATRDTADSRTFNSTPQGPIGGFAEQYNKAFRKIRLHWMLHPDKRMGAYTCTPDGQVEIIAPFRGKVRVGDGDNYTQVWFPDEYPFRKDGKIRSPWYDEQEDRCATPTEAAQELDIDFGGSVATFFQPVDIDKLIEKHCRAPVVTGELDYSIHPVAPDGFIPTADGRLKLWVALEDGHPPRDRSYKIGMDTATGTGTSNSVAAIYDARTREKVGIFVSPNITPTDFAHMCIALGKWFSGPSGPAELCWEMQGPGGIISKELASENYPSLWHEVRTTVRKRTRAQSPGWQSNPQRKLALLEGYRRELYSGSIVNPCADSLNDCRGYVYQDSGFVEHMAAINSPDGSGARANHGDRTIADALAVMILGDPPKPSAEPEQIPYMSPAYRMREHDNNNRQKRGWNEGWRR